MSSYGPGRDAPIQLFGGLPLEQSMEEIRVQHYLALAAGTPEQSASPRQISSVLLTVLLMSGQAQLEAELAAQANQQVQNALEDMDGALDYIANGAKNPSESSGHVPPPTKSWPCLRTLLERSSQQAKVPAALNSVWYAVDSANEPWWPDTIILCRTIF